MEDILVYNLHALVGIFRVCVLSVGPNIGYGAIDSVPVILCRISRQENRALSAYKIVLMILTELHSE